MEVHVDVAENIEDILSTYLRFQRDSKDITQKLQSRNRRSFRSDDLPAIPIKGENARDCGKHVIFQCFQDRYIPT